MRLLLSGEGPTDLGICRNSPDWPDFPGCVCDGHYAQYGPLAIITDKIAQTVLGYSLRDYNEVCFVNEATLTHASREFRANRPPMLPGIRHQKDTGFFRRNAQALGVVANGVSRAQGKPVIAILFRDCDGTSTRSLCPEKYESIKQGFIDASFEYGVAMMPRPKSEAWLLCALKPTPYQNCGELEQASGNDNSPNSLKNRLVEAIGHTPSVQELIDWIENGRIDYTRIHMESWEKFLKDFQAALKSMVGDTSN